MKKLLFILLTVLSTFISVKAQDAVFTIKTNQVGAIQYCTEALAILPALTIEGSPALTGLKISISEGYIRGEDELFIDATVGTIQKTWYDQQGYLVLAGGSNAKEYEDAIRLIQYKNKQTNPTVGPRKITISLNDADYLPATGHFYRYIKKSGISWSTAKAEAESDEMRYYGLKGYLATITSQAESDFIRQKTSSMGWIGATDAEKEEEWKWVTGPEAGTVFWRGNQYGKPENGAFSLWNEGEPNDVGDAYASENYAHITFFPNDASHSYKWNDLPERGGDGDYAAQGYLIEFGGMPGDPVINLTATLELQVNTVWFDSKKEFTICEGDEVTLNRFDQSATAYFWSPSEGLSSPSFSNPIANPKRTTVYQVTGKNGSCSASADFTVTVNPAPVSLLNAEENICQGIVLSLDPGEHESYSWNNGETSRTITVSEEGEYSVKLVSDKGCTAPDSKVLVHVHQYPKLDLSQLDTLICGSKTTTLAVSSDKGILELTSTNSSVAINQLQVTAANFGTYPLQIHVADQYGCSTDTTFSMGFHPIPTVSFTVDSSACYGYNLDVKYLGDARIAESRFTWIFGGDTIVNEIGAEHEIIPLGINKTNRNLTLVVEQQGCQNSETLSDIKVIPNLDLTVKERIGCEPFTAEFLASNTENVSTYDWEWGDGHSYQSTVGEEKHQYLEDGDYDVKLTVTTDQGCTNWVKINKMVYVAPIPTVEFSLSPDECLNPGENQLLYTGSATDEDSYQWDLSALDPEEILLDPATGKGPLHFDLKNKPQATIGLKVITKFLCASQPATLLVKRKPVFDFTASLLQGCTPLKINFDAAANDPVDQLIYNWNFGDEATANGLVPEHLYLQPDQQYTVSATATSSLTGCRDTMNKADYITTHPNPTAAFAMDHDIVYNDSPLVKFSNQSENATAFLWNFSDQGTSTDENPEHRFLGTGHQKALLTAFNEFLCSDTISRNVLVAFNKIFPPNAFSPNAPNEIDRQFRLYSSGIQEAGYSLKIMSRWNDIVFEAENQIVGWDGRLKNGQFAAAGNYVWVLEYIDFLNRKHKQSGAVTLIY